MCSILDIRVSFGRLHYSVPTVRLPNRVVNSEENSLEFWIHLTPRESKHYIIHYTSNVIHHIENTIVLPANSSFSLMCFTSQSSFANVVSFFIDYCEAQIFLVWTDVNNKGIFQGQLWNNNRTCLCNYSAWQCSKRGPCAKHKHKKDIDKYKQNTSRDSHLLHIPLLKAVDLGVNFGCLCHLEAPCFRPEAFTLTLSEATAVKLFGTFCFRYHKTKSLNLFWFEATLTTCEQIFLGL